MQIVHELAEEFRRKLDVWAAAAYCGVSKSYLDKLRSAGGGPTYIKIGRRIVYAREDVDDWLTARRRRSTAQGAID